MSQRTKLLGALVLLAVAVIASVALTGHSTSTTGIAEINLQLPNTQNTSATLNGTPLAIKNLDSAYSLSAGEKQLKVTRQGYKQFSTSFDVTKGQTVIINVVMQPVVQQSQSTATVNLNTSLATILPAGFTLQQVTYFYSNFWAVAQVSNDGNNAIVVAQYIATTNAWQLVLGPGTYFDSNGLTGLPPDVTSYMYAQHYAIRGTFANE